ncbi:MAG TPA: c-type cytochrome, partial [Thermoanaerobaculia bacterium]|nr:c-type cytochrome [Thermoanaerobaculia bacterium]
FRERCASCHGADGKKLAGDFTLASGATQARPDAELARAIRENPAHKQMKLESAQVDTVVAYVKALQ